MIKQSILVTTSDEYFIQSIKDSINFRHLAQKFDLRRLDKEQQQIVKQRCNNLGINIEHFNKDGRTWNSEELIEAVKNSDSLRQTAKKLNLNSAGGGTYKVLHKFIKELNLDTSHFLGQAHYKGKTYEKKPKYSLDVYLNNERPIGTYKLKNKLFKAQKLEQKCYECGITEWRGKPAPLELDHIDGNNLNNNLSNLRILCPNCHAQTDTYRGSNTKRHKENINTIKVKKVVIKSTKEEKYGPFLPKFLRPKKQYFCSCGNTTVKRAKQCNPCRRLKSCKFNPDKATLEKQISEMPMSEVGKLYSVSDNAVRKKAKTLGIDLNNRKNIRPRTNLDPNIPQTSD